MINLASNLKKTLLLEHEMSCLCGCVSPLPQPTKKIAIGVANSDFLIPRIERLFCFEYQAYIDSVYSSVDIVVNRLNSSCVIEVELTSSSHQFYLHVCVEVHKCISVHIEVQLAVICILESIEYHILQCRLIRAHFNSQLVALNRDRSFENLFCIVVHIDVLDIVCIWELNIEEEGIQKLIELRISHFCEVEGITHKVDILIHAIHIAYIYIVVVVALACEVESLFYAEERRS